MKIKQRVMSFTATEGNLNLSYEYSNTQYLIHVMGQYTNGKYTSYVSANGTNLEEIKRGLSALLTFIAKIEELEVD